MTQTSIDELRGRIARCGSLAEVIVLGLREQPAWLVVDVIVQDEYTHDVIVAAEGAAPSAATLVLDCT